MRTWSGRNLGLVSAASAPRFVAIQKSPEKLKDYVELRNCLLAFIADFGDWDNSAVKQYFETARALTEAAHISLGGAPATSPMIVDPFAGGGAIPLEGARIGADVFASDLNPIPVLLNKLLIEYVPQYGQRLATDVRIWGNWIDRQAKLELAPLYPQDLDGRTPIAYLWARTILCEGPGCGARIPLIRSLWLRKKKPTVALRLTPNSVEKSVRVEVINEPKSTNVGDGTVRRGSATCPCCGYTTPADRVKAQFKGRMGGAADAQLLAVVTTGENQSGRRYRPATDSDYHLASGSHLSRLIAEGMSTNAFPTEPLPYLRSIFNINLLDVTEWRHLFTPRQLVALATLVRKLREADEQLRREHEPEYCDALCTALAFAIDRQADYGSSLCRWVPSGEFIGNTFGRQALGIIWDFAEPNPIGNGSGNFQGAVSWVAGVCDALAAAELRPGHVQSASATHHVLPDDSAAAFVTDPPYYDAVPYADLSDFFYVWLKRSIGHIHKNLLSDYLTPKTLEVVQLAERNEAYAYKSKENFETLMTCSLSEGRRITRPDGIGVVVFAHKATHAWETMLQSVIDAGWIIVASWPIDTEMGARLRAKNSATLSSSVHLVCRPRENSDGVVLQSEIGDWRDVLSELPRRIHDWMPRLAEEGVVGADAIFACLGPALEVFSRYSRVEKANGEPVTLREYLEQVWAAVAKEALAMVFQGADATGFEPDARLTAMWLWTLSAGGVESASDSDVDGDTDDDSDSGAKKPKTAGYALEYDAARKIAQGLGASLESMPNVVEISGDIARLLSAAERTNHLFGKEEAESAPGGRQNKKRSAQLDMFAELTDTEESEVVWKEKTVQRVGDTTLDRVHQSMILFAAGRGEALKRFLVEDGVGSDGRFWRLAQALSALFPASSEEKRWVDGVLARKKGLGF